jgi:hypothetical protein
VVVVMLVIVFEVVVRHVGRFRLRIIFFCAGGVQRITFHALAR